MRMASPMLKEAWTIRGDSALGRMWRAITRASLAPRGDPKTCWKTSGPRPPGIGWPSRRGGRLNRAGAGGAVGSFGPLGGAIPRRPAAWVGLARSLAFPGWAVLRRLAGLAVIALAIALLSAPHTEATPLERSVRRLAETVLGEGTVQVVQVVNNGRVALVRWEAATYKPESPLAETRESRYGAAELTTGG